MAMAIAETWKKARTVARSVIDEIREDAPFASSVEVAYVRALASKEADPAVRNPDVLAEQFLTWKWRLLLRPPWLMKRIVDVVRPGGYYYHNARTKHIDGVLVSEAAAGVEQLVMLGAGNDSRAYRLRDTVAGMHVFEVDLPATQVRKQRILRQLYGSRHAHVSFVPVDFETDSLGERLAAHGYDPGKKTLFNWEGVSFFLSQEAVDGVLAFVRESAGPGSSIVFDYSLRSFNQGDLSTYGAKQLASWLAKHDLPYDFGVDADEMRSYLEQRGFELISDIGPEELEDRYLRTTDGFRAGRVWGNFRIAHARKK